MLKIDDNFSGYLKIEEDKFAFHISQSLVTLLPAESEQRKIQEVLTHIHSRNVDNPEFIFGYDGNRKIALERNTKFNMDLLQLSPIIRFRTPIIIKATGNTDWFESQLTAGWDRFHAITFWGGNINAVFPPVIARKHTSPERQTNVEGTIAIELHPSSYYTHSTEIYSFSVKISIPLENTGVSSVFATSVWPFSLIFSLARRNEGNFFQAVPTTLSSSLAEVRLASLVAWA